jgi:hypothetical protein
MFQEHPISSRVESHSGLVAQDPTAAGWLEPRPRGAKMTGNDDLQVEVRGRDIIVTMPNTSLRVVYRKPDRTPQLVARLDYFQDQQKGPITRAEFPA